MAVTFIQENCKSFKRIPVSCELGFVIATLAFGQSPHTHESKQSLLSEMSQPETSNCD
jgi:hypothetical protein